MGKTLAVLNPSTKLVQQFAGITWKWEGMNGQVGEWRPFDVKGERIVGLFAYSLGTSVRAQLTADEGERGIVCKAQRIFPGPMPIASVYSRRDQRYFDAMEWASRQYQSGAMFHEGPKAFDPSQPTRAESSQK